MVRNTVVGGPVARKPVPMVVALLVTLALMLAPAAQQEAHAKDSGAGDDPNPGQGKCIRAAKKAGLIGPELNPSNTTFISGTNGNDSIYEDVAADEVFCGFGGRDTVFEANNFGVVLGGPGNDWVSYNREIGTVIGGAGNDYVEGNYGTFNGGEGDDYIWDNVGTFNGGAGNDLVIYGNYGTFNGGEGDDRVGDQLDRPNATFNGGPGCDTVDNNEGGTVDLGDQSECPA
jgi:hypothetical protein